MSKWWSFAESFKEKNNDHMNSIVRSQNLVNGRRYVARKDETVCGSSHLLPRTCSNWCSYLSTNATYSILSCFITHATTLFTYLAKVRCLTQQIFDQKQFIIYLQKRSNCRFKTRSRTSFKPDPERF